MGRPTKRTQFIKRLFKDIETDPWWQTYKDALYKEYILHLTTGSPRWLYDHIKHTAESYWDYMNQSINYDIEELITDMGDVLDTPITRKLIEGLTGETTL